LLLRDVDETVRSRSAASEPSILRWNLVVRKFGLTPTDEFLLLACIAPWFSTGFELAFERTGAVISGSRVRLSYVADLLARGDEERWALLRALHPSSHLVASGLVTLADSDAGTPFVDGMLGASPILFDFLLEQPLGAGRPPVLASICEVVPASEFDEAPPAGLLEEFGHRLSAGDAFVVRGGERAAAESIEGLAAARGFGLVRVDWIAD
jgi:hypothetical protein